MRLFSALSIALVAASATPLAARDRDNAAGEAALSRITERRDAGKPVDCINLRDIRSSEIVPNTAIVYPDPPMSAEEERLFAAVAPRVQLRSFTEWLAGAVR